MLTEGDNIRMVKRMVTKPVGMFDRLVGRSFEVIGAENGLITVSSSLGIGFMSEEEYKKYFVMVRKWTTWIHTVDFYAYKTDNKKYVKVKMGKHRAKASCHPNDVFDLKTGIDICLSKIREKEANNSS